MLRYYYINKEWMLSLTARRMYRTSAVLSLMLFFIIVTLRVGIAIPTSFLPIVRLLLFVGVVGAATTTVAMEYFLFGFDKSPSWKKVFWFCMMLLPPLGPSLYCLIACSHSNALKPDASECVV